jgi:conjugal transfer mating pair stabilization protein TraN
MIAVAAKAGYAAVSAYTAAVANGQTAAQATNAASTAAQNQMMIAFDPTSLAIAIVVYLVMSYLTKACPADDMTTALMADSGYCHLIGEHCVTEMLGSCTQSERVYCCFNSKLARIIQEQGRAQVPGMNVWGDAENPNCRGFTPTEFQALDFSKIDLTEYYVELRHQTQTMMKANIKAGIDAFQNKTN